MRYSGISPAAVQELYTVVRGLLRDEEFTEIILQGWKENYETGMMEK